MRETATPKDSGRQPREQLVAAVVIARYINELALERPDARGPSPTS
jgi:hypothetical protein